MYATTFYSFKGGVGRTMALINVAAELIQKGRRVLVVDFDLEAPGIPTFDMFGTAANMPGIVDYVSSYLATGTAPDARQYLTRCDTELGEGELWVMSAGKQDSTYSSRLNSIDWQQLYSARNGYLLFEDLKEQWREILRPDYVLIDSRTGHTDVAGICTRQLPDAVVAMFFPNDQNLVGLTKVSKDIRAEADTSPGKDIKLHFVASNVPNLDDEDLILHRRFEKFQSWLQFNKLTAVIQHYNSLSLVDQVVFSQARPRSRLAQEYKLLASAIIRENLDDKEGALATLSDFEFQSSSQQLPSNFETKLTQITTSHTNDGEVLSRVASIRERGGDYESALALLTKAINAGHTTFNTYLRRASVYRRKNDKRAAIDDIVAAMGISPANYADFLRAVRALAELQPDSLPEVIESKAFISLPASEQGSLAKALWLDTRLLTVIEPVFRRLSVEKSLSEIDRDRFRMDLVLALIGQQKFRDATEVLAEESQILASSDVSEIFNYAMAKWGVDGRPPRDLFARVAELGVKSDRSGPNFNQCLALANYFAGHIDRANFHMHQAARDIRANPRQEFSAWRYLVVSQLEFLEDLKQMEEMFAGKSLVPRMFEKQGAQC